MFYHFEQNGCSAKNIFLAGHKCDTMTLILEEDDLMELIKQGKTKDVYKLDNGNYLLKFKDDVTGENGVFDPGANTVGLTIEGVGKAGLEMSEFFFDKIKEKGIPTHCVKCNFEEGTMEVLPAKVFGKGLEVICRQRAVGSFFRRYGDYIEEAANLPQFVEFTIKDDHRQDPLISPEAIEILNIMSQDEAKEISQLTRQITQIVSDTLKEFGLDLYDIKFEFGRTPDNHVLLIDEISGGNMRVFKGDQYIEPLELHSILFPR